MAVSLSGLNLCDWSGFSAVIQLTLLPPPYPQNCVALWKGFMWITQGGPFYGQITPFEVLFNGNTYFASRDCGNGIIQTASLSNPHNVVLAGANYTQISGPTAGPGAGGAAHIRAMAGF